MIRGSASLALLAIGVLGLGAEEAASTGPRRNAFYGVWQALSTPFYLALFSGDSHPRGSYRPAPWPYALGHTGWLVPWPSAIEGPDPEVEAQAPRKLTLRLGASGALIDSDTERYGLETRVHLPYRLEAHLSGERYAAELGDLDLYAADALWRALQYANVDVRVGGGLRWRDAEGEGGTDSGAAFVVGLRCQPRRPFLVDARGEWGGFGEGHWERYVGEIGAIWRRYEGAFGWERTSIGTADLDGPYAALRVWF